MAAVAVVQVHVAAVEVQAVGVGAMAWVGRRRPVVAVGARVVQRAIAVEALGRQEEVVGGVRGAAAGLVGGGGDGVSLGSCAHVNVALAYVGVEGPAGRQDGCAGHEPGAAGALGQAAVVGPQRGVVPARVAAHDVPVQLVGVGHVLARAGGRLVEGAVVVAPERVVVGLVGGCVPAVEVGVDVVGGGILGDVSARVGLAVVVSAVEHSLCQDVAHVGEVPGQELAGADVLLVGLLNAVDQHGVGELQQVHAGLDDDEGAVGVQGAVVAVGRLNGGHGEASGVGGDALAGGGVGLCLEAERVLAEGVGAAEVVGRGCAHDDLLERDGGGVEAVARRDHQV